MDLLAKFSVKKPLTIFVAAIAIVVLGVVSFTRMTPDLMPNINLPYVMIMTAYPGASPETVEMTITKPVEQAMATLDGINNITSTSSENYSMVVLEFQDRTNMDTVGVDIAAKLDLVEPYWEDSVGTPTVLKINPSMLPVMVASVDADGLGVTELTDRMNETLLSDLEGAGGVASVNSVGLVENSIHVVLSQQKIDQVNDKVVKAIHGQFEEAEEELADSKKELEDGKSKLEGSQSELQSGQSAIDKAQSEASDKLASASTELTTNKITLQQGIATMDSTLGDLNSQLEGLQDVVASLEEAKEQLQPLVDAVTSAQEAEASAKAAVTTAKAAMKSYEDRIDAINQDSTLTAEEKAAQIGAITSSADYLSAQTALTTAETAYSTAQTGTQTAEAMLHAVEGQMGMTVSELNSNLSEARAGVDELQGAINELNTQKSQLQQGLISVDQAMTQLEVQKSQLNYGLASKVAQLAAAQASITSGLSQMDSAEEQLKSAEEQIADSKEQALDKADLHDILTMSMVSQILTAQNFSMPAGYIQDADDTSYLVRVGDHIADCDELKNLVLLDLGIENLDPIRLSDVCDIFVTDNANESYAKINGNDGIVLTFTKQSNCATAEVSENIQKRFAELSDTYEGLHFTILMDQGEYIRIIVRSVLQNLLVGAVLAIIVLFLFLRDWRPTLIIACSIPFSVVFAVVWMYFTGISLNMISLSGLAIGVGMLVDNSVVVIENIYRLRSKGYSLVQSAVSGASQVSSAIVSSTLTTICVFLPIVFVEGITREIFTDLALTLGYSLIASLIVALTLVPAMSRGMLQKVRPARKGWMDRLQDVYGKLLAICLKHRALVLAAALLLMVVSLPVSLSRGLSFMPDMESTEITASLTLDEELPLDEVAKISDEAITRIQQIDGVQTVCAMVSNNQLGALTGASAGNTVSMYVLLNEDNTRPLAEISNEMESACADLDGELSASGASDMTTLMALGSSGVSAKLYGDDLDKLRETAAELAAKLETVDGLENISDGQEENTKEISFVVDKNKAMEHQLTVAQIFAAVNEELTDSKDSTSITYNGMDTTITVQDDRLEHLTPDDLYGYEFEVTDNEGKKSTVQLQDLADIEKTEALGAINRSDQRRYLTLSATVKEGYNATTVAREAQALLKAETLPAGLQLEFSGELETILDAMEQLLLMLALAIMLIYFIMVAQFQSLKSPFIVMFTIPLAFTGGFLALFLTGQQVSVISVLGFVMLSGIIVNNGIVLVDYVNRLRLEGMEKREALIEAGKVRMRPIFMTALTTILGLTFVAFGVGTGAEIMQPIGIVCIGGLLYATLMTLFVIPVIYDLFHQKEMKKIDDRELLLVEDLD